MQAVVICQRPKASVSKTAQLNLTRLQAKVMKLEEKPNLALHSHQSQGVKKKIISKLAC